MSANSLGGAAGTGFDSVSLLQIGTIGLSDGLEARGAIFCGFGDVVILGIILGQMTSSTHHGRDF